jgi:hypothetical protein
MIACSADPQPMHIVPRPLILSRNTVIVALAVAIALVLGIGVLSAYTVQRMALADAQAHRAKETLAAMTRFLAALGALEEAVLAAHDGAREAPDGATLALAGQQLAHELASVQAHFGSRPELLPLLVQLERSAQDRSPGSTADASSLTMMRHVIHALQRHEFSVLAELSTAAADQSRGIHRLISATVGMAILLGVATAWMLLRRRGNYDELITVCAWTRRVLWEGRWISFEEYLARRFDLHCTHGICDEAAEIMRQDVARPPGLPVQKRDSPTRAGACDI